MKGGIALTPDRHPPSGWDYRASDRSSRLPLLMIYLNTVFLILLVRYIIVDGPTLLYLVLTLMSVAVSIVLLPVVMEMTYTRRSYHRTIGRKTDELARQLEDRLSRDGVRCLRHRFAPGLILARRKATILRLDNGAVRVFLRGGGTVVRTDVYVTSSSWDKDGLFRTMETIDDLTR